MTKHFISYSPADALDFAFKLRDELEAGPPPIPVWLDKRDIQPGQDWDEEIAEALKTCVSLIFVMTNDSVGKKSVCKREWTRALKYKKPIIPIKLHADAEMPFRLDPRQHIDFTRALESENEFNAALARLRKHFTWLASPAGVLQAMKDRLADAERDLLRDEDPTQQTRIQDEIDQLKKDIAKQEEVVRDPKGVARRTEESIARGLERERQPERPVAGVQRSKFINPPPGLAPTYFQDRHVETGMLGGFLKDAALRLMTVVGRGGTGKTAIVCRLLKSLEGGQLPDDGGPLDVNGIVYLSATGTRRVNTPNLYSDLSKLLTEETAAQLDTLFKNPQAGTEAKMSALLSNFNEGRTVVLLDNFEDMIDPETLQIRDAELDEALCALLTLPHHTVKVILTTRLAPQDLALVQPGRQRRLDLDKGLDTPYAENILREMDADGKVGLKDAPDFELNSARERTRGYPRALEALFAILSADRDTTLRDILKDTAKLLPENVVRELVGEAFSRLDPVAQQVMQALAVYRHPVTSAAVDYLLQPYLPGVDSALVLKRLVNMLFARREAGHYYLHPVDRTYALSRVPRGEPSDRLEETTLPYTQYAMRHRAAEYFKQARLPREDWKTIEDLAPQLAEFDLRCEGEDYDTAAVVLLEIDYNYLLAWGFYRQMAEMHERLRGNLGDPDLEASSIGNLGTAYRSTGQVQKAISCYKQALKLARENKNRPGEGAWLGNLGACYADTGQTTRAIDYFDQSLAIDREIGSRQGEGIDLGNLGACYSYMGQTARAFDYYEQALAIDREIGYREGEAIRLGNLAEALVDEKHYVEAIRNAIESVKIAEEINNLSLGSYNNGNLALARLYANDLSGARAAAEAAQQYDEPNNNDYVLALLGLIALRQGDVAAAQAAFTEAVAQAETMLTYSAQNFKALDSKGLALCGRAVCGDASRVAEAAEAYKAARAINKDAGIVRRVLRLFDALAESDAAGALAGVRAAAAGE
ncbi:MAG TPA: tetratricopeptide repeat protein [Pyrinomonadaceae bacterium]|nr:tetratricopeptide repeat protein [Pyrinomonadaceae bacterium]